MIRGVSKWDRATRDFDTVLEHDMHIIDSINAHVGPNDTLYHLGDVSMDNKAMLRKYMREIECQTVHLILGNHDHHIKKNKLLSWEGTEFYPQTLFSSVVGAEELEVGRDVISMYHYPASDWRDKDCLHKFNGYMFHGHVHGQMHDRRIKGRIDVGMDSAFIYFGEYRPFELSEAIELSLVTT